MSTRSVTPRKRGKAGFALLGAAFIRYISACAHAPPPRSAALPSRPECHSSIDAVLAARTGLALTEEQAHRLHELDDNLQAANAAIRAQSAHPGRHGSSKPTSADAPNTGSGRDATGEPLPGNTGASADMGGRTGSHMGGGRGMNGHRRHAGGDSSVDASARRSETTQEKMDSNDSAAYLEAESLLTADQRPRAREIAERYREQLFEWREVVKARRAGDDEGAERR